MGLKKFYETDTLIEQKYFTHPELPSGEADDYFVLKFAADHAPHLLTQLREWVRQIEEAIEEDR